MFISYFLVFFLAAVPLLELVTIVPLAIFGGLSPLPVAVLGFSGNLLTVVLLIIFADKAKCWWEARKLKRNEIKEQVKVESQNCETDTPEQESKKKQRARNIFNKFGLPGLTILGPMIVGSHISALMAMRFGLKRQLVFIWMLISLVLWTVVSAMAASFGVAFFLPNVEENGFLINLFK